MTQLSVNAISAASVYVLVGVGFALVFRVAKFFHFAHGAVFVVGAYSAFLFARWLSMPFPIAVLAGVLMSTACGLSIEHIVYRPLRKRGSGPLVLLLASLGMYILLQNLISCVFGDGTKSLRDGEVEAGIGILGARITPTQIVMAGVSASLVIAVATLLKKAKLGRAMRAVAHDRELAVLSGIDTNRIFSWTFALGSALAGIAGILVALDTDMTPTMGMNALMMGVVAVIIGGVSSIPGVVLGALLLGTAQHFGAWGIGSQWQDAIAFFILLAFLLVRPQGILGKQARKATV